MKRKIMIAFFVIIAGVSFGQQLKDESQDIHQAVTAGNLGKVKALLESDSRLLESKDGDGNTPLNLACGAFQVATSHFLIDKKANVNARNNYGLTTLHLAIGGKGRDIDLIRKLNIQRG